jgi:hypothetical protein
MATLRGSIQIPFQSRCTWNTIRIAILQVCDTIALWSPRVKDSPSGAGEGATKLSHQMPNSVLGFQCAAAVNMGDRRFLHLRDRVVLVRCVFAHKYLAVESVAFFDFSHERLRLFQIWKTVEDYAHD